MRSRGHFDIRKYKKRLRERYMAARASMTPEQRRDAGSRILAHLLRFSPYLSCKTLLCYVSTAQEADTRALITHALAEGKCVATPICIKGTRDMHFHIIKNLGELIPRTFGILEPDSAKSPMLSDFSDSICIVPGLSFDFSGYRLGYGGGYYDRFLSGYEGVSIGLCYRAHMRRTILRGRYDLACKYIAAETGITRGRLPHRESPPS